MTEEYGHNWVLALSWRGFMHKSWECAGCGLCLTEGEKAVLDELLAIKKLLIEQPAEVHVYSSAAGKAAKGEQVHFTSCVCGYSMPYAKGKCCKCGREL